VKRIKERYDPKEIFHHTGKNVNPCYVLPQLMWFQAQKPEIYRKTYKVLMAHDYILYRLTGRMVTDLSMASGTLAYDIHEKKWMTEWIGALGLESSKFPELMVMGQVAGTILPYVAEELGLSPETKIVVGGQDQRCASLGAGIDKGIFTVSLGTASSISALCDKPVTDENMQVTCCGLDENHDCLLRTVMREIADQHNVYIMTLKPSALAGNTYHKLKRDPKGDIHGGEYETSCILHIAPELVDTSAYTKEDAIRCDSFLHGPVSTWGLQETKTGLFGDPTYATAELGKAGLDAAVTEGVKYIRAYYEHNEQSKL